MQHLVRVAIYARVSTEEQAEHGYSIDAQLETLRNYCKMHGKLLTKEYVDRGVSGKSINGRYELQRMLRDAKNHEFDEVVVWKISRLARKTIDLLRIVEELSKYNISFRSFSENFETETPMGKFALQMMGAVGELERNTIVDNVRMGMKQRAREGKWNGGVVLGYKSISVDAKGKRSKETKLVIVDEEAVIIRKIFELYASGKGLKAIANQINYEGYKTKKGNTFGTDSVKQILLNPIYIGEIRFNRFEEWNERRRKGKNENFIQEQGNHQPIISLELWDKVQAIQQKKSHTSIRNFDGKFLLTGLMKCPKCGASMVASRTKSKLKDGTIVIRRYYSCGAFRSKGSSVCNANSVRADYAEQHVMERLTEVVNEKSILKDIIAATNKRKKESIKPMRQELSAIEKRIEQFESKRKKYFALYEDDFIEKEMFSSRLHELQEEQEKLSIRKSEILYKLDDESQKPLSYEYVKSIMKNLKDLLLAVSTEQKKILLHLFIKEIKVNIKKEIEYMGFHFNEYNQKQFLQNPSSIIELDEGFFINSGQRVQSFSINL